MMTTILASTKVDEFLDGIYLGLAVAAVVVIYLIARKFRLKG